MKDAPSFLDLPIRVSQPLPAYKYFAVSILIATSLSWPPLSIVCLLILGVLGIFCVSFLLCVWKYVDLSALFVGFEDQILCARDGSLSSSSLSFFSCSVCEFFLFPFFCVQVCRFQCVFSFVCLKSCAVKIKFRVPETDLLRVRL